MGRGSQPTSQRQQKRGAPELINVEIDPFVQSDGHAFIIVQELQHLFVDFPDLGNEGARGLGTQRAGAAGGRAGGAGGGIGRQ